MFLHVLQVEHKGAVIRSQAFRVRLANGLWYKVDHIVIHGGRWMAYEVKGPRSFRGGFEMLKTAAAAWPEIEWFMVWRDPATGYWKRQEVLP
jgi:hypothetical protein